MNAVQSSKKNLIIILLFFFALPLSSALFLPSQASALEVDAPCEAVEIIFARGSGDGDARDEAAEEFFEGFEERIHDPVKYHPYALGEEQYNGYKYPHVAVGGGWSYLTGINAFVTAGDHFVYKNSVNQGVNEFQSYITQRHTKCMESDTLYVLGGYSQGAQVIGQALPKLNRNIRDDIVYVGLFGDPKLHYPEGEGVLPVACLGERSAWRRVPTFNCLHDNGSLGSRKPYLPGDMHAKTGLWCYRDDFVCDPGSFSNSGHGEYKNPGMAIDHAAQIAVTRLQGRLKQDNPPKPPSPFPPLPWEPAPINYDQALNVRRIFNQGTTGENVVFIVDVSESMRHHLPDIEQHMRDTIPKIVARGGKVAAVFYYGIYNPAGFVQPAGKAIPFDETQRILDTLNNELQPKGNAVGSQLAAINATYVGDFFAWTQGATKSIISFSNNPIQSPDIFTLTIEWIAKVSLIIDPVNVYPVVPKELKDSYAQLAEQTSGQVITYTNDTELTNAANQAFEKITNRPVPFLGNTEYIAEPGQEVTFDASDSYVIDGEITKYDWDYDGDGQFEASTTTPSIKHTYTAPFTGHMQVRITADNGTLANMSAKVQIDTITPPTPPEAPQNLTHTINSTVDNKSTVTINWQSNPEAHTFIQINDMPMGHVEPGQTSLEITDIDRAEDVVIGVASAVGVGTGDVSTSTFSTTTVPKITPPAPEPEPPVTSTCTQSNFFVRLFCKTIAIFKYYLNGIWHYILPYRV